MKRVTVSGSQLVKMQARGSTTPQGICDDCLHPNKQCRFCHREIIPHGPNRYLHRDTNHAWCKFQIHAGAPKTMPYPLPRNEVATP